MPSERLYYDDSYTTRFSARVAEVEEHEGRHRVELEATYFFPESGGQEADRGTLGAGAVTDVQVDEAGRVWHTLAEGTAPPAGELAGEVDWARRFDNMQQHTGQHILSAAFERVLQVATLSSHLGEERSAIEMAMPDAGWKTIERIEEAANRVVWEDRAIALHWADDQSVKTLALRKPPKVSGRIRIVEIPDWDLSACGGTHTRRTGEVGVIKITRWEKVRGNVRFEFLCGARALHDHAWRLEQQLDAAKRRTIADRDLIAHLERAATERDDLKKQLAGLMLEKLAADARTRVGDPPRGVADLAEGRSRDDTRSFALKCLEAGAPWVVAGSSAPEPCLVVARAKRGSGDLKSLLPELLARGQGKGGGAPDFLQLACGDSASAADAFQWAAAQLPAMVSGA